VTIPAAGGFAAAAILILIGTWNEFLRGHPGRPQCVTITPPDHVDHQLPQHISETPPPNLLAASEMVAVIPADPRAAVPSPDHHGPHRGPLKARASARLVDVRDIRPAVIPDCPCPRSLICSVRPNAIWQRVDSTRRVPVRADGFVREILTRWPSSNSDRGRRRRTVAGSGVLPWIHGLAGLSSGGDATLPDGDR